MLRALVVSEPGTVSSDLCCTMAVNSPKERGIRHPNFCIGLCKWCIAIDITLLQQQKEFLRGDKTP